MRRLAQKDIPGLGTILLQPVTLGVVAEAHTLADQVPVEQRADVFVNFVLSSMFVEPKKTAEEVAALDDDVIAAVVDVAVDDLLENRDTFNQTPHNLHARVRLYQAYIEEERQLSEQMSAVLQNLMPPAGTIARIAESVQSINTLVAQVQKSMRPMSDVATQVTKHIQIINEAIAYRPLQLIVPKAHVDAIVPSLKALKVSIALPEMGEAMRAIIESGEQMHQIQKNVAEIVSRDFGPLREQMQQLNAVIADSFRLATSPLQKLTEEIARAHVPAPYLFKAMIASGLNSPMLHSPTYVLPRIEPTEIEVEGSAEDTEHQRLVDAYDTLSQFEQSLRELIEDRLREVHGDHWWKRGVPEDVRKECEARKQGKEKPFEAVHPPLYYAYVYDYQKIIVRGDNWKNVFAPVFGNKTELDACFVWVSRVRDSVAHIRPVSGDDYLMFVAGVRWFQVRIKRMSGGKLVSNDII